MAECREVTGLVGVCSLNPVVVVQKEEFFSLLIARFRW
jgi:hypothetical protein